MQAEAYTSQTDKLSKREANKKVMAMTYAGVVLEARNRTRQAV
jgi:hypothetical protein